MQRCGRPLAWPQEGRHIGRMASSHRPIGAEAGPGISQPKSCLLGLLHFGRGVLEEGARDGARREAAAADVHNSMMHWHLARAKLQRRLALRGWGRRLHAMVPNQLVSKPPLGRPGRLNIQHSIHPSHHPIVGPRLISSPDHHSSQPHRPNLHTTQITGGGQQQTKWRCGNSRAAR